MTDFGILAFKAQLAHCIIIILDELRIFILNPCLSYIWNPLRAIYNFQYIRQVR